MNETDLKGTLETCLNPLLENDAFKSISLILDSSSYQHTTIDSLIMDLGVVKLHFNDMLTATNCNTVNLNQEFEVLHDHVTRFLSRPSPEKCWPIVFKIGSDLGITNLLHLIEICLVMLLANAKAERLFSFLWQVFSKEHQSMKHDTLEMLLYLHGDADFQKEQYVDAVSKFMTEYPDGTIRKQKRRLASTNYPSSRKSAKKSKLNSAAAALELLRLSADEGDDLKERNLQDTPLDEISNDEWSSDVDYKSLNFFDMLL